MSTGRILIVYGTTYGQTAKIAERMRQMLIARDFETTLVRGDELPAGFSAAGWDGVIVGASVIGGRHQRYVERFILAHRDELAFTVSAFFSVSGSAGSPTAAGRTDAQRLLDDLLRRTGWRPAITACIAGAITYTKYGFIMRWVMKRISRKNGGSTDTSRDHEYTDWAQVERFAASVAAAVAQRPELVPASPA